MGFLQGYSYLLNMSYTYCYKYSISNNIINTLLIMLIIIEIIESGNKRVLLPFFILYQIIAALISDIIHLSMDLSSAIFCLISISEGGLIFIFLGIIIYLAKNNKKRLVLYYLAFCVMYFLITQLQILPRVILKIGRYNDDLGDIVREFEMKLSGLPISYTANILHFMIIING